MDRRSFGMGMAAGLAGLLGQGPARALDLALGQVTVDVKVIEVVNSTTTSFGIDFGPSVRVLPAAGGRADGGAKVGFGLEGEIGREDRNGHDRLDSQFGLTFTLGGGRPAQIDIDVLVNGAQPAGQAGYDRSTSGLVLVPTVSLRKIDAAVVLNRESAFLVEGLLAAARDHTRNEIPRLSDVPVVGSLFRSKAKYKDRPVLLVFITPTVVTPPGG